MRTSPATSALALQHEAMLLHRPDRPGFAFIGVADPTAPRGWRQRIVRTADLPSVLGEIDGQADAYLSQASFSRPTRSALHLQGLRVAWVDIDLKDADPTFRALPPSEQRQALIDHAAALGYPPSWIVASGRGYHLKWRFEEIVTERHLPRWREAARLLVRHFRSYGADPACAEPARVLRIPGTVNSRSGTLANVCWVNETMAGLPVSYGFFEFWRTLRDRLESPDGRWRGRHKQAEAVGGGRGATGRQAKGTRIGGRSRWFDIASWAWAALGDLRRLRRLRYGDGGAVREGARDLHLFYECTLLALAGVSADRLRHDAALLAREIEPFWGERETIRMIGSLMARVERHDRGERIEYPACSGQMWSPVYSPSNRRMIEIFSIMPEEMARMRTLIARPVKRERQRVRRMEQRRADGAMPRDAYRAGAAARQAEATRLRAEGHSWPAIGAAMGISAGAARQLSLRARAADRAT